LLIQILIHVLSAHPRVEAEAQAVQVTRPRRGGAQNPLGGEVEGLRCLVGGTLANGAGALPRTTTALLAMYGLSLE
jgi:hypothetical protein